MKVLQVYKTCFPHSAGGVDVVVGDLLRHADGRVRASLLRTADWTLRGVQHDTIEGITVHALHLPLPPSRRGDLKAWIFFVLSAPGALLRLARLLRATATDVVHLHTLQNYHLYFILARALGGPPFIITLHRAEVLAYPQRAAPSRWIWRLALRRAVAVTAVSDWLAMRARQTFSFLPVVHAISNGIEMPAGLPEGPTLRRRLGLPADYFIMVGTCQAYKGHDTALRAWAAVHSHLQDSALVIVGDGELYEAHRALCVELGIADRVHMTGQLARGEALALMRDSLALLMPSRSEGLAIALLEAGMLGVAVICSDIGAFRALVEPNRSGLVFALDDVADLAHKLRSLAGDPALRAKLGTELARRVSSRYAAGNMIDGYVRLYASVLGSRAEGGGAGLPLPDEHQPG